jgi:hypothetical protein
MIIDATGLVTNPLGRTDKNGRLLPVVPTIGWAIHHTVGNSAVLTEIEEFESIRAIDRQHVQQGYGGFAYNYIVFQSGRAYHSGEGQRAHVALRNHELRGIAMSGTFTDVQPTDAALNGLREVLRHEGAAPHLIKGHREWALPGEGTACPGVIVPRDWFAFMAEGARVWLYGNEVAGCEIRGEQLFYWHNGIEIDAVGDYEGAFPGAHYHNEGGNWRQVLP